MDSLATNFTTGTGTTAIALATSFPVQAGLVFGTRAGAADLITSIGGFSGTAERSCGALFSLGNTNTDSATVIRNDACLTYLANATTTDGLLDVQALDDGAAGNGVTFVPDDAFANDNGVFALLLGGLTDAFCGAFTLNAATGTQDITGLGFDSPDVVFFWGASATINTIGVQARLGFGFATADGSGRILAFAAQDAQTASNTWTLLSDDYAWAWVNQSSGAVLDGFTGFTGITDGFRINKTVGTNGPQIGFLALKGCQAKIVDIAARLDTNNQSVTGTSFTPEALVTLWGLGATTASMEGTPVAHLEGGIGIATDATHRFALWNSDEDNLAIAAPLSAQVATRCFLDLSRADGTTVQGSYDFVDFTSDGCTLDQVVASTSLTYIPGLFLGDAAAGGGSVNQTSTALRSALSRRRRRG